MSEVITEISNDVVDQQPSTEVEQKDPVEEASEKFTTLLPFVKKFAEAAEGKKSLVRVLHAFAEFPLGASKPKLLNHNERMLFNILQELQGYKSTILTSFMKQNLQKMQDERKEENGTN